MTATKEEIRQTVGNSLHGLDVRDIDVDEEIDSEGKAMWRVLITVPGDRLIPSQRVFDLHKRLGALFLRKDDPRLHAISFRSERDLGERRRAAV